MLHCSGQSHFNLLFKQECHKPPQMLLFLWLSKTRSHPSRAWSSWAAGTPFPCERAVTCAAFSEDTHTEESVRHLAVESQDMHPPFLGSSLESQQEKDFSFYTSFWVSQSMILEYGLFYRSLKHSFTFFWWVAVFYFYYLVIKKKQWRKTIILVQSVSVPRPKSLPEARTLHFGQCEGSIKAETCTPPKRVMTGSKELSKQQRSWLQICNKVHLVYGRQALNSERKICPNSIIHFIWWKCHWDSPWEKTNAAPEDAEISETAKEDPGWGTCQTLCWDYSIL